MALRADEAAHLGAVRVYVRVVGRGAGTFPPFLHRGQVRHFSVTFSQCLDAIDETGTRNAEPHRIRVVAVDAGDGVSVPHVMQLGVQVLV